MAIQWKELMENAGSDYEPLPSGDYDVEISKSEPKTSQNGKSMFKVQMKVLSGPHANSILFHQFVVSPDSPNALSFFFQHMRALGLDATFFAQQPTEQAVADALLGRRATVNVGQRDWQGKAQNEVKKVTPLTGGVTNAPTSVAAFGVPNIPTPVVAAPTTENTVAAPPTAPF